MSASKQSGVNLYEASHQWRNRPQDQRFETLAALKQAVEGRRLRSRSEDISTADIDFQVVGEDTLLVDGSAARLSPSHWSFGQLCQRVGAPADYLRKLPTKLVADNLRHSVRAFGTRSDELEAIKFLTIESDNGANTLQAVTSRKYGRIWDADVVQACERIVDRSGGKFFNPKDWSGKHSGLYASDHDCFVFMIDGGSIVDAGCDRDQLHRGFFMWNSETGAKTFGLQTFLFRFACGNHIVWHAEDIQKLVIRHTSGAPARFDKEAFPLLTDYVNASAKPVEERIRRAKQYLLPPSVDSEKTGEGVLLQWAAKLPVKFTRSEIVGARNAALVEEGACANYWDLVNGLTAHARGYDFVDARVDLENRAGKLLELVA